jgi:hypothetical protein
MQYELVRSVQAQHQIGGTKPDNFKIPNNEFLAGFQYLGFIDNVDEVFSWLPFKVNLIHPIYCDVISVYLDYSNPSAPVIIEPKDTASETSPFDDLTINSEVVFEATSISLIPNSEIDEYECIGIAGNPQWLQEENIPICPKNGKPMRFLCQLMSFSGIKATYTNVIPKLDYEKEYFENLNFWCDGSLYIFIEPESRTMCYTMQNT